MSSAAAGARREPKAQLWAVGWNERLGVAYILGGAIGFNGLDTFVSGVRCACTFD
ncbi:MAG: hypothetical protein WAU15_01785 [Nitrosomonas sp.]